jgi:hypothetical protein
MAMTEAEWLICSKPIQPVMDWLRRRGSNRQFYLLSVAVLRLLWEQLDEQYRDLVLLVEKYADAECTDSELSRSQRKAEEKAIAQALDLSRAESARLTLHRKKQAAALAAAHAAFPDNGWISASNAVSESVRAGKRATMWPQICVILRDIFGNPFHPVTLNPAWRTSNVTALAQSIYDDRAFDRMPILADALEDAGCDNADILNHCRQPSEHVRGCWVVDLVLGMIAHE